MFDFPEWLSKEMENKGVKQADLVNAGVDSGFLSQVLSHKKPPGPVICRDIAKALKLPQWVVFYKARILTEPPQEQGALEEKEAKLIEWYRALPSEEAKDRLFHFLETLPPNNPLILGG